MSCERSMATLLATMVLTLVAMVSAGGTENIFEWGEFTPVMVNDSTLRVLNPPKPMLIITPKAAGVYPVLFFIHGTSISNLDYTQLFHFVASHGIIVVAPLLFKDFFDIPILPSHQEEIDDAAEVANWLSLNLNTPESRKPSGNILPDYVVANLSSFTVSGHSRGAKSAFALVLGKTEKIKLVAKISALIALDPVAGTKVGPFKLPTTPYILNNKVNSLDISIPTMIIGTGLGSDSILGVSCAPEGLNHDEFYKESKTGSHFVISDYGHCDMLNDNLTIISRIARGGMCVTAKNRPYDVMRRTVGGLIVAFSDAYFEGDPERYCKIIADPTLAPTKIDHVGYKGRTRLYYDA